jgi:hypothetical protein
MPKLRHLIGAAWLTMPFAVCIPFLAGASTSVCKELPLPPKALVVGQSARNEQRTIAGRPIGFDRIDTLYESDRPYDETVRFFEDALRNERIVRAREGVDSASFTVERPDGELVEVTVRDTVPPMFEVTQAHPRG